jgi:hypothetical protein
MQVDFIISRMEFAIVEISGKGKDGGFTGPNSASTVKSLQNLLFPYRLCDDSYAAGKHLLVV